MYTMANSTRGKRGVSAVETVVGISLIALVLLFSISTVSQFVKSGSTRLTETQGLYLTEETLESARAVADLSWGKFVALPLNTDLYIARSTTTVSATTTVQTVSGFTSVFRLFAVNRDAVTNDIVTSGGSADSGTRLISATTTWSGGSFTLTSYMTDLSP